MQFRPSVSALAQPENLCHMHRQTDILQKMVKSYLGLLKMCKFVNYWKLKTYRIPISYMHVLSYSLKNTDLKQLMLEFLSVHGLGTIKIFTFYSLKKQNNLLT